MGPSVHNLLTPNVHNLMTLTVHEVLTLYTNYADTRYQLPRIDRNARKSHQIPTSLLPRCATRYRINSLGALSMCVSPARY